MRDAILSAIQWCANNPFALFWVIIPAALMFGFAAYRIVALSKTRGEDAALIKELVHYHTIAVKKGHSAEKKTKRYFEILGEYPNNTLSLLLYKYVLSQKDFSNILIIGTYPEYIKVGKAGKRRSRFRSGRVTTGFIFLFVLLSLAWAAAVNVAAETNMFDDAIVGGLLSRASFDALVTPFIILLFTIASLGLLIIFRSSVVKYKKHILSRYSEKLDEIFQDINLNTFPLVQPDGKVNKRILRMIEKEGINLNEPEDLGMEDILDRFEALDTSTKPVIES